MMRNLIVLMVLSTVSLFAVAKDEDCGHMVDMADSYDFQKMFVECEKNPISVYDSKDKKGLFSGKEKPVDTYDEPVKASADAQVKTETVSSKTVDKPVVTKAAVDNAGAIFNIRGTFSRKAGPMTAVNGLFEQMFTYCPNGFEKLKEWVVPAPQDYYLHYQFQCAE